MTNTTTTAVSYGRVLDALRAAGRKIVSTRGGECMAQCPAHDDGRPSLHVTYEPARGGVLLRCFAGCEPGAVLRALGLDWGDLWDAPTPSRDANRTRWRRMYARTARTMTPTPASARGVSQDTTPPPAEAVTAASAALDLAARRSAEQGANTGRTDAHRSAEPAPAGPAVMLPAPCVPEDKRGGLSAQYAAICAELGIQPARGVQRATCPVCATVDALRALYVPLQAATLLRCDECGDGEGYAMALVQALHIDPARIGGNGTAVMAYDTPTGAAYRYGDGLTVTRTPDKSIRQHGNTRGTHPLWLANRVAPYAQAGRPVILVEGEKDAATLWALGYAATTAPGGGGNLARVLDPSSVTDTLRGAHVIAVMDRDDTGRKWGVQAAHALAGAAASVEWVQAAGAAHDATDAVMMGVGFTRLDPPDNPAAPAASANEAQDTTPPPAALDRVTDGDDGDDAGTMPVGEAFWRRTPELGAIRDAARARLASPWATLAALLVRVAVTVPAHVVVPAFIGGRPSPLNLYAAIVGPSGAGKGAAESVAAALWPDLKGAETGKPGSGEGLVTLYADRVQTDGPRGDDGKPTTVTTTVCRNPRALLSVPEVRTLGGVMARQGSTLTGELASAWTGEPLGAHTKHETYRAPALAYRLGLITGVQEGNAGILTGPDAATTGLTQRFLWAPATDTAGYDWDTYRATRARPLPSLQPENMPDRLDDLTAAYTAGAMPPDYPWLAVTFPDDVAAIVFQERAAALAGRPVDPLDTHATLLRLRVAALLPWIATDRTDRLTVTPEDWDTAGDIMAMSRATRAHAIAAQADTDRDRETDRATVRRAAARAAADREDDARDECAVKLVALLTRRGPLTGRQARNGITARLRPYAREVLDDLAHTGTLTTTGGAWSTATYATAKAGKD